jgi:hypothetical protein
MNYVKENKMNYKAPDSSIHFLDSVDFTYLLPINSVPITDEEVKTLQPPLKDLTYQELRVAKYPPVGDQLDALWKGGDHQAAMHQIIRDVKLEFPKP